MLSSTSLSAPRCRAAAPRAPSARPPAPIRRVRVSVSAHGHPHGAPAGGTSTKEKQEKEKGFINDMRRVAMKLHTKEQSPKEGEKESKPQPRAWQPTLPGYLSFLVESKAVYDVLQAAVKDAAHPEYAAFSDTGLERSAALADDIAWMSEKYGLQAPAPQPDGPGAAYGKKLTELAKSDPQAFICHYYNFYFAHTAGGRMIGNKISEMLLDGQSLKFYQYDGEVQDLLDDVRRKINALAETWTPEQKSHCLEETENSFKFSGQIMQRITAEN